MPLGTWGQVFLSAEGGRYRARTRYRDYDGVVREVERWADTESRARNRLLEAVRDRQGGHAGNALSAGSRFADAAALWIAEVTAAANRDELSLNTLYVYECQLRNHVLPALGELRLREITPARLDAAFGTLRSRLGAAAVRSVRTVVSGVLGLAVRHDAIATNPTRDARRIKGRPRRAPRALTTAERELWRDQLDADPRAVQRDLPDLTEWLTATGVRIGEALAVGWDDVDIPALPTVAALDPEWDGWAELPQGRVDVDWKIIRVHGRGLQRIPWTKTPDGHRTLILPRFAVQMLWRRNQLGRQTGPVFPDSAGGWRDPSNTSRDLREARGTEGFEWVTFHVFRKTCATILDEAGLSARIVADQLGHSRPSMTQDVYMGRGHGHPAAAAALDAAGPHGRRRGVSAGGDLGRDRQ
jgi:integrase